MTYELAKQLNHAAFPQKRHVGAHYIVDGKEPCFTPTLSDHIEECGALDFHLQHYENREVNQWNAFGSDLGERYGGDGSTLEEAVAKLWLALQPKLVEAAGFH